MAVWEAYSSKDSICTIDTPHQCVENEEIEPMINEVMSKDERTAYMNQIIKDNAWRTHTFKNQGGE